MARHHAGFGWTAAAVAALLLGGCNSQPADETSPPAAHEAHDEHAGHAHDHAAHGPHDGELIELGDGEYHGELVHDAGNVTIYILDDAAKQPAPIDAAEVTINVVQDGKPAQFPLAAAPQDGDDDGKSSRFRSDDADLAGLLIDGDAGGKLLVTIGGTSYSGAIEHHDHDGHNHDH